MWLIDKKMLEKALLKNEMSTMTAFLHNEQDSKEKKKVVPSTDKVVKTLTARNIFVER